MMKKVLLLNLLSLAVISLFAQSTQVGLTTYDLQTNNSGCRRVATNAAGEVVISYTRSYAFSEAAPDRGTGYNFYNPVSGTWSESTFPAVATNGAFTRFDAARTGWPNVAFLSNGQEVVVSHYADDANNYGGLQFLSRTAGTGAWSTYQLNSTNGFTEEATWPRIATSGDSIIIVSSTQIGTFVNGVDGGLYFHRSFDGGATWTEGTIPFVNGNNFVQLGADVYSIDANDNGTVAMVVGRYNAFILKSTDFGTTWTTQDMIRTTDANGVANANNYSGENSESAERQDISDESYSLVVDDQGDVHVWAGRLSYEKAEFQEGQVTPFTEGLIYWNETMDAPKVLHASRFAAEAGSGCNPLYPNAVINDPNFVQFSLYASSFVSQPSGAYNDNGDLVVAYTRMRSVDTSLTVVNMTTDNYLYKDVFLLKSTDNGVTWEGPINVSQQDTLECAYPSIPRKFYNNEIPLIWQQDERPGNALQEPTGYSHNGYQNNKIMYANVDASSIITPADITCPELGLIDPNVSTITITAGCAPTPEEFGEIFIFDDVPNGPELAVNMVQFVGTPPNVIVPGTYVADIYLEDFNGNISDTVLGVTIVVVADNTPPTYTFNGPDTLNVIVGTTYNDPGIEIADNGCSPNTPPSEADNVNTTIPGLYTYVYTITDNAGNTTTATRYVEVIIADNDAPVITMIGGATDTVEVCTMYTEKGATAFDLVDYNVPVTINSSALNVNVTGSYNVIYTASDNALPTPNTATATRVVYVVDNTAPLLTITDDNDLVTPADSYTENGINYTYEGTSFVAPTATGSDPNCSGQVVTVSVDDSGVNTSTSGNYTAVFTAEDENGNQINQNLTVRVGKEPTADFDYITTSNGLILTNTSTDNPTSYLWDFGNGQTSTQVNSSAGTPIYSVNNPTYPNYDVCLTVKNRFNDAPFNKTASTTCKTITLTGIADRNELDASIQIFPNPTTGLINIEISETGATDLTIEVTNVLGSVIATKEVAKVNTKETVSFDLSGNSAGVYFINISSDDASTSKRVIVK